MYHCKHHESSVLATILKSIRCIVTYTLCVHAYTCLFGCDNVTSLKSVDKQCYTYMYCTCTLFELLLSMIIQNKYFGSSCLFYTICLRNYMYMYMHNYGVKMKFLSDFFFHENLISS